MLLGQHRGGSKEGHLLAAHHRLEGGAQSHLGLSETDIAAEEAIHWAARLHVLLDLGDRSELIGGLSVGKALLQLPLPGRVWAIGVSLARFALCLKLQQTPGVKENRFLGSATCLGPLVISQRGEIGGMLADPDITGNLPSLIDRDEEPRIIRKLESQHLPLTPVGRGEFLKPKIAADTMLGVNHQVSFGEFREIDGRPRGTLALAPKMKPTQTLAG